MAPPDEPLPFTRDACLRALGLDPSTRHDASSIDRAYRQKLFSNHPDTSGVAGSPESLNRVIHARNMLSSGSWSEREKHRHQQKEYQHPTHKEKKERKK